MRRAAPDSCKFPGLAMTPPMGWNSWNKFACDINETLIRETADALVETGMRDAGYVYLNLDDCWHGERDHRGIIHPHPERFPSGMKALGNYIHSKGLKFGIYSDAGRKTCAGRPGSHGHEYRDARRYASWGVDYLKYDWCYSDGLHAPEAYRTMGEALVAAGRPVVFSICEWGQNNPWEWGREIGHLWRTTGDIHSCFDCTHEHETGGEYGILQILDMQDGLRKYAGLGHWNDPDMLQVGNLASANEDRAHFTMWAMLAAPLIAGNDIRNMSGQTLDILTNRQVIAVNQDPSGVPAFRYSSDAGVELWFKPLSGGDWAVTVLNRNQHPRSFSFDWHRENVVDELTGRDARLETVEYRIRDLWRRSDTGTTGDALLAEIPGRDVLLLHLTVLPT